MFHGSDRKLLPPYPGVDALAGRGGGHLKNYSGELRTAWTAAGLQIHKGGEKKDRKKARQKKTKKKEKRKRKMNSVKTFR